MYENNWKGLWTLEWNETQEKFHIESADTRFEMNMDDFLNSESSEWYTLGVFNSYDEAQNYKDFLLKKKESRLSYSN